MKCLYALALILAAAPAMAQVNWTTQQLGNYTYYNGTSRNGLWTGTSQQLGNYQYQQFHGPQGQSLNCTTNQLGGYTYTNCN